MGGQRGVFSKVVLRFWNFGYDFWGVGWDVWRWLCRHVHRKISILSLLQVCSRFTISSLLRYEQISSILSFPIKSNIMLSLYLFPLLQVVLWKLSENQNEFFWFNENINIGYKNIVHVFLIKLSYWQTSIFSNSNTPIYYASFINRQNRNNNTTLDDNPWTFNTLSNEWDQSPLENSRKSRVDCYPSIIIISNINAHPLLLTVRLLLQYKRLASVVWPEDSVLLVQSTWSFHFWRVEINMVDKSSKHMCRSSYQLMKPFLFQVTRQKILWVFH